MPNSKSGILFYCHMQFSRQILTHSIYCSLNFSLQLPFWVSPFPSLMLVVFKTLADWCHLIFTSISLVRVAKLEKKMCAWGGKLNHLSLAYLWDALSHTALCSAPPTFYIDVGCAAVALTLIYRLAKEKEKKPDAKMPHETDMSCFCSNRWFSSHVRMNRVISNSECIWASLASQSCVKYKVNIVRKSDKKKQL